MGGLDALSGRRVWHVVVAVVIAFASGVALGDAGGLLLRSPMLENAPAQPLLVSPRPVTIRATATAVLTTQQSGGREITSPRDGVMTDVQVTPGSSVSPGSAVLTIDGSPVFAYTAAYPLYRDLTRGVQGDDVVQWRSFLNAAGQSVPAQGGRYDVALANGTRAWRKKVGLPAGEDAPRASLVWIGPSAVTVGEVTLRTGDRASGVVFRTTTAPSTITVIEGARTGWEGVDPAATLAVAGVTVPYRSGAGRITEPAHVQAVAGVLARNPKEQATIQSEAGTAALALPTGAILTDASGRTCVRVAGTDKPAPVTVSGGSVGTVFVAPDAALEKAHVAARPDATGFDSCG